MKQKFLVILLVFLGVFAQGLPALGQYQIGYKADLKQGDTLPLESLFPYEKGKGSLINVHGGFPVYLQLPKGSQNIGIHDPDIVEKRGDSLLVKKPGSARLEVDRGAYLLYISLRAELLYGSAQEVATGTAPVAPKKILILSDQDLDKHVGVTSGMFVASWWSVITPSGEEETFSDNEGVFSIPVRDLLALGRIFSLTLFDGCEGYDPHTGESYGDSNLFFEIIDQRTPVPTYYTVNLSAQPAEGGSVSGDGTYNENTEVTVVATPTSGWRFLRWTEGAAQVSTSASYTFRVTGNCNLVAHFEQIPITQYQVSLSAQPAEGGQVTGGGTYNENTEVTVVAIPTSGWRFVKWTEGSTQVSDQASFTFQITSDSKLVAVFEKIPLALPKNFKLEKTYQRDAIISWQAGGNEKMWKVSYGDTTVIVTEPKATLRGLDPNTDYTIEVRAKIGENLSEPLKGSLKTGKFSEKHNLIPHIYGMKEFFSQGEILPIFWKDLEKVPKKISYSLSSLSTSEEKKNKISTPIPEAISFSEKGNFILTFKFEGHDKFEEIEYLLEVK